MEDNDAGPATGSTTGFGADALCCGDEATGFGAGVLGDASVFFGKQMNGAMTGPLDEGSRARNDGWMIDEPDSGLGPERRGVATDDVGPGAGLVLTAVDVTAADLLVNGLETADPEAPDTVDHGRFWPGVWPCVALTTAVVVSVAATGVVD